jgi:hypothetical protein
MSATTSGRGRLQLLAIAAVFFGPLAIAAWLYFAGEAFQPEGSASHGTLLEPIMNVGDALSVPAIAGEGEPHWLLVYAAEGPCGEDCRQGLFTTRQLRLMLGREMERVVRVFLHGEIPPDKVFLAEEHEGLVTLQDPALAGLLSGALPAGDEPGGYYLVDPLGNLVMYFAPGLDPGDIVSDLKRLLRLSRIG